MKQNLYFVLRKGAKVKIGLQASHQILEECETENTCTWMVQDFMKFYHGDAALVESYLLTNRKGMLFYSLGIINNEHLFMRFNAEELEIFRV